MKVVFDARAVEDLDHIFKFIAADNSEAARNVVARIIAAIERLASFPEMARLGRVEKTRELVIPRLPYIAVYRIDRAGDRVVVAAIFHGAQDRSEQ
jgi:addiction module RelE/StbE family toxin